MGGVFAAIGALWVLAAEWQTARTWFIRTVCTAIIIWMGDDGADTRTLYTVRTQFAQTIRAGVGFIHSANLFHFLFLSASSARGAGQSPAPLPRACRFPTVELCSTHTPSQPTRTEISYKQALNLQSWYYLFVFSR